MNLETPLKIRTLQKKLYCKAKVEPAFRFYLLYDNMSRADILFHACRLARADPRGTGGGRDNVRDDRGGGAGDVVSGLADGPRGEDVQGSAGAPGDDPEVRRRRTATGHPDNPGPGGTNGRQACP